MERISVFFENKVLPNIREIGDRLKSGGKIPGPQICMKLLNEDIHNTLLEVFNINDGKISYLDTMLLWFPDYLTVYINSINTILFGDGALSIDWRFYIALMVGLLDLNESQY